MSRNRFVDLSLTGRRSIYDLPQISFPKTHHQRLLSGGQCADSKLLAAKSYKLWTLSGCSVCFHFKIVGQAVSVNKAELVATFLTKSELVNTGNLLTYFRFDFPAYSSWTISGMSLVRFRPVTSTSDEHFLNQSLTLYNLFTKIFNEANSCRRSQLDWLVIVASWLFRCLTAR